MQIYGLYPKLPNKKEIIGIFLANNEESIYLCTKNYIKEIIDYHMERMELEETETMSIDEAREMTLTAVRKEYARP